MNNFKRKRSITLALIIFSLGVLSCKSNSVDSKYSPNEFTLLLATSNHGEVGPCG
ncbi:hypothetical protein HQ531_15005 [bacterium]|nr:hypothetical protein [bacterium]